MSRSLSAVDVMNLIGEEGLDYFLREYARPEEEPTKKLEELHLNAVLAIDAFINELRNEVDKQDEEWSLEY